MKILSLNSRKSVFKVAKILLFLLFTKNLYAQDQQTIILWSSTKKLTAEDFKIKIANNESNPSFGQFSIDYSLNGFDFLTKNFNQKVRNYMISTASWIDTTESVSQNVLYQQTLFDISEIYVRKFRKQLRENRRKIWKGTQFAEKINSKIITDFSERRVYYTKETAFSKNIEEQKKWERQILKELIELEDYKYER